ncbi:MAG: NUDIX domain-containing protein [Pirellulales bacterium]|nr:NUDIX domain-containing protein [Pirellulales bacterium]
MQSSPPSPDQVIRAAGVLLMVDKPPRRFLLMRHPKRWDLPKGHCEPHESFLETALRETHEETGISRDDIRIDADFSFQLEYPVTYKRWNNRTFTKQVHYFLGFLDHQPELQLTEHEAAEWFDWNPPHQIQSQTIDPLLAAVGRYLGD